MERRKKNKEQNWDKLLEENKQLEEEREADMNKIIEVHDTKPPKHNSKKTSKGKRPHKRMAPGDEEISPEGTRSDNYKWNEKSIEHQEDKNLKRAKGTAHNANHSKQKGDKKWLDNHFNKDGSKHKNNKQDSKKFKKAG